MKHIKYFESVKIYEYNKGYIVAGDIIVMNDEDFEIIQDVDDNNVWSYEYNEDGGSLAKHHLGSFNWWINNDDVKVLPVDEFVKEYPKHKKEIMDIYSTKDESFELVHDTWSKNKKFLVYIEAEKYNL